MGENPHKVAKIGYRMEFWGSTPKQGAKLRLYLRKDVGLNGFRWEYSPSYNSTWRERSKFRVKTARMRAGILSQNPLCERPKCKDLIQAQVLSCFWSVWPTPSPSHVTA